MIKRILTIMGGFIILILLGFWGYLLLFDTPQTANEIFVDLGLKNPTLERPLANNGAQNDPGPLSVSGPLNQLSIKPVAGYVAFNRPGEKVRYAERGTGHIYEINFTTNIETRVLGNTVAKTTEAHFSPDGTLAVLISETDTGTAAIMTTIPDNTGVPAITTKLPDNLREIEVTSSTTVNYLLVEDNESVAYTFNRMTGSAIELWRIPFTEIKVWWGGAKTYVVNKPAPYLKGAVYEVSNAGELKPLTASGFSYSALYDEMSNLFIETKYHSENKELRSHYLTDDFTESKPLPVLSLPEKCAVNPIDKILWCGASVLNSQINQIEFIRDWYIGKEISNDRLWSININKQQASLALQLQNESGVIIDLISPSFNQTGTRLFFQNKIDDTLWMYQVSGEAASNN